MTQVIGTFRVGEDIAVALDIASGTAPDGLTVTASMKRGRLFGDAFEPASGAQEIALTVAPRTASGDIPAGWNLSISAAVSADLAPGLYGIDARLETVEGVVEITDTTAAIRLERAVIA